MKKKVQWLPPVIAALIPLVPLLFLYNQNADMLDISQVLILGAGMAALSLAGYFALRLICRSAFSGVLGCLLAWIGFFAYNAVYNALGRGMAGSRFLLIYAAAVLAIALAAALLARKARSSGFYPLLGVFLAVLLAINAVPALQYNIGANRQAGSFDEGSVKSQFNVDASSPSPNVYWIHCDGMLGFAPFETYFGDAQSEFRDALAERGFEINPDANFEGAHATQIATTALYCPDFYDRVLAERLKDNASAMQLLRDSAFRNADMQYARMRNELNSAFRAKGYTTQMIANYEQYLTVLVDRYYKANASGKGAMVEMDPQSGAQSAMDDIHLNNLAELLMTKMGPKLLQALRFQGEEAAQRPSAPYEKAKEALINPEGKENYAYLMAALQDAMRTPGPTLTTVAYMMAHYPFLYDEDGNPTSANPDDIMTYPGHHVYATKVLLELIDQILSADPQAVIVLQGDHGLHGQTEAQIAAAFGADAVLPLWNGVISALRVPEADRTGEETQALATPLNLTRYLINAFVGQNYQYLPQ